VMQQLGPSDIESPRSFSTVVRFFPLASGSAGWPLVKGIVFYGRRRYVKILHCYLLRNLIANGGLLSEVSAGFQPSLKPI
jgi:hypothetical protein